MSDISKINVGGVDYDVKDNVARQGDTDISDIKKDIKNIQDLDVLQNADITALKDNTKNYVKKVNGNAPDTNGNVNISLEELNGAERAHASSTTDYGVGDSNQYGHLKLSDGIQYRDIEDKDIVPTPGIAASKYDTQKMGKELSDRINSIADIGDGDIITSVNNIAPIKGTHDITLTANDIFVNQTTTEIKPNSIQDKINKINIEPNPETTEEDTSLTSIKIGDTTYKIESSSSPSGGQTIQVTSLPEPSAELIGTIYQYIGPSDMSYTNGYFYKCESEEQEQEITNEETEEVITTTVTIYFWNRINVQPSNGGEGGTSNYDELENRPSINGQLLTGDKSLSDLGINNFDGKYTNLTEIPETFTPASHTHMVSEITDFPTIPTKVSQLENDSEFITIEDIPKIDNIQVLEMPEPTEEIKNKIVQYVGETDENYKNGYFYKCQQIEDTEEYEWKRINVQPSGGGEGGTSDYNELDNRPKIAGVLLSGDKSLSDLGINNFDGDYEKLTNKPDKFTPEEHTHLMEDITDLEVGNKVSVSATGESDDEIKYITVDDVEYKIADGGSSDIEINPESEVSSTISSLKINGVTYDLMASKVPSAQDGELKAIYCGNEYGTTAQRYAIDSSTKQIINISGQNNNTYTGGCIIDLESKTIQTLSEAGLEEEWIEIGRNKGFFTTIESRSTETATKKSDTSYTYYWHNTGSNYGTVTFTFTSNFTELLVSQSYGFNSGHTYKLNSLSMEDYKPITMNPKDLSEKAENLNSIRIGDKDYKIMGGGSAEQIQSDWTETNEESKAFIQNKPLDLVHIGENIKVIRCVIDDEPSSQTILYLKDAEPNYNKFTFSDANNYPSTITCSGGTTYCQALHWKKDLTNINTVTLILSSVTGGAPGIAAELALAIKPGNTSVPNSNPMDNREKASSYVVSGEKQTITIDVSDLTGEHYILLSRGATVVLNVENLYME